MYLSSSIAKQIAYFTFLPFNRANVMEEKLKDMKQQMYAWEEKNERHLARVCIHIFLFECSNIFSNLLIRSSKIQKQQKSVDYVI